jgi:cytochrome c peroxidase
MKTRIAVVWMAGLLAGWLPGSYVAAHIIPAEKLHPVAESYRRACFILNLNPIRWDQIRADAVVIGNHCNAIDPSASNALLTEIDRIIAEATVSAEDGKEVEPLPRQQAAAQAFEALTRLVARAMGCHLEAAGQALGDHASSLVQLRQAQGVWGSFEDVVRVVDVVGHRRIGECWLRMMSALGTPGLLGFGAEPPDGEVFRRESAEVMAYVDKNFGSGYVFMTGRPLAPWPHQSATFDDAARLPMKLPPGSNINKQIPRPRQVLGMAARGVDERGTALIALGDMAFDSSFVFGEPARSLGISCNTCHNKSITNPNFFVAGLSARPGGMDVSNSYFAPHANNGHFDPLDIPDLRGIRFTGPYGRNGRFASLREFTRNVIVGEFNGEEPDPLLLDGMIAYMNEFDFLPNPALNKDGTLNGNASEAARRGEKIFARPFQQMGGKSCATCHIPSANFVDHQQHDIGTVKGAGPHSRDRSLDTPTLLSAKFTPPYFHDGSQPTLRAVNEWFNKTYDLKLSARELDDLTAYVEAVGDGTDAYEDTPYYLDAELEEFSFFLSAVEFLDSRNKSELMNITFQTVASEIRNHKWELQDAAARPILEHMAELMDQAHAACIAGDRTLVRDLVAKYRELYHENVDILK